MIQSRRQKGLMHHCSLATTGAKCTDRSSDRGSRNQGMNGSATTIKVSPSPCHLQSTLQRIDCEIHETATSQCTSKSTLAPAPYVCEHGNDSRGSTKYLVLDSLTSRLARSRFAFTKHAIEFCDKGCEFVRVHFLAGLFGEVLPMGRLVRGHRAPLSCSPGFLKLLWIPGKY